MASFRRIDRKPVLWRQWPGLTPFAASIAAMHAARASLAAGDGREEVWLLEHPTGFSPGATSKIEMVDAAAAAALRVPIDVVPHPPRAGDWTYHGPGMRAVVVLLDLRARRRDTAGFVAEVCSWIIAALADLGIAARREDQAIDPAGIYVGNDKIAAMGFRMTSWVSSYGFALYVDPILAHFGAIAPCGIKDRGVTSLAALGAKSTMAEVDVALRRNFEAVFGATSLVQ